LVAAQAACRAGEGAGDVILVGPALLDQADHRMRLGHVVVDRELGEHDA
jgi:hypothetical protein